MTRTARQKAIRRALQVAKRAPVRPECPTPAKRAFDDDLAVTKALQRSKASGKPMRIYNCPCGFTHLTSQPIRKGVRT